jgi:hypothetical protein
MANLTAAEQRFIELDREKEAHRKFFDELNQAAQAVADEKGVGHVFQDDQGIVYRVHVPRGRYVEFRTIDIERTRRPGEAKGSLSLVQARLLGFEPYVEPKVNQTSNDGIALMTNGKNLVGKVTA